MNDGLQNLMIILDTLIDKINFNKTRIKAIEYQLSKSDMTPIEYCKSLLGDSDISIIGITNIDVEQIMANLRNSWQHELEYYKYQTENLTIVLMRSINEFPNFIKKNLFADNE